MADGSLEDTWRAIVSGARRGPSASAARGALRLASWAFGAGARARDLAFRAGLKTGRPAPLPVISIGNLTAGGTGKTPVVAWLAARLIEDGERPGILSRGYRAGAEDLNDEGRLLELLVPEALQVQQPDRVAGAARIAAAGATVALLDDGFQHRRLKRELDIVLLDALEPFGFDALLPRGLLREPVSGLRRADGVLITRAEHADPQRLAAIRARVAEEGGPDAVMEVRFEPAPPVRLDGAERDSEGQRERDGGSLDGRAVMGCCAIGHPAAFRATLESLGARVVGFRSDPDHHIYTADELDARLAEAVRCEAEALVITAKDAVKIQPLLAGRATPVPVLRLDITARPAEPEALLTAVREAIAGWRRRAGA